MLCAQVNKSFQLARAVPDTYGQRTATSEMPRRTVLGTSLRTIGSLPSARHPIGPTSLSAKLPLSGGC
eukprot:3873359-Amphidinium_carterae.1